MRLLSLLVVVGLVAAVGTGCAAKREEIPQIEPGDLQPAPAAVATTTGAGPTPPVIVETPGPGRLAVTSKADTPAKVAADGSQTYTVLKGDTFGSLILDANKAKIKDPNVLPVGTVLTIPPK